MPWSKIGSIKGPKGDQGIPGPQGAASTVAGPKGDKGDAGNSGSPGPANSLSIGAVTTGAAGSSASATVTGSAPSQTLNLTIPRGDAGAAGATGSPGSPGSAGPANSLAIGTVTTGAAGSSAAATITGTPPSQTLNLTIPRGDVGQQGTPGSSGASADIVRVRDADLAGVNVNTAQAIFGGLTAITLAAQTLYDFEMLVNITRAAGTTSHTTGLSFGGTATLTNIDYLASVGNPAGGILGASSDIPVAVATNTVVTAANTSATENLRIWARGVIRANATGTLIPQFQYSAAPGGAPTIKRNSFIILRPRGVNTMTALN